MKQNSGQSAGVMHGIMIKRLAHNVRILDRPHSSPRIEQAAGMCTGLQGLRFLKEHDLDARPYASACPGFQMLDKQAKIEPNFDSFESNFCPEPPTRSKEEGKAVYDLGKRGNNVIYKNHLVTVELDNLVSDGGAVVHADIVVVADGAFSTIRHRLLPSLQRQYSGYVAWRSTIAGQDFSQATRIFLRRTSQRLSYAMPGENGGLETGKRLLKWVWYFNRLEDTLGYSEQHD
ncbi:hypothetical protein N7G274_000259 [Stereocaulon virgatum]|uniref:2,6-dihydroxypyridine 3-monooxygenase substrate binding domain-containing protein n=1 Tax=Stereocaulon virgatum TaxID=373712 RepID=A0ABR4AT96_9LECA